MTDSLHAGLVFGSRHAVMISTRIGFACNIKVHRKSVDCVVASCILIAYEICRHLLGEENRRLHAGGEEGNESCVRTV